MNEERLKHLMESFETLLNKQELTDKDKAELESGAWEIVGDPVARKFLIERLKQPGRINAAAVLTAIGHAALGLFMSDVVAEKNDARNILRTVLSNCKVTHPIKWKIYKNLIDRESFLMLPEFVKAIRDLGTNKEIGEKYKKYVRDHMSDDGGVAFLEEALKNAEKDGERDWLKALIKQISPQKVVAVSHAAIASTETVAVLREEASPLAPKSSNAPKEKSIAEVPALVDKFEAAPNQHVQPMPEKIDPYAKPKRTLQATEVGSEIPPGKTPAQWLETMSDGLKALRRSVNALDERDEAKQLASRLRIELSEAHTQIIELEQHVSAERRRAAKLEEQLDQETSKIVSDRLTLERELREIRSAREEERAEWEREKNRAAVESEKLKAELVSEHKRADQDISLARIDAERAVGTFKAELWGRVKPSLAEVRATTVTEESLAALPIGERILLRHLNDILRTLQSFGVGSE